MRYLGLTSLGASPVFIEVAEGWGEVKGKKQLMVHVIRVMNLTISELSEGV